jgi:hypothetical protein
MKQQVMKKGVGDLSIRRIDTGALRVNDQTFPIPKGESLDITNNCVFVNGVRCDTTPHSQVLFTS